MKLEEIRPRNCEITLYIGNIRVHVQLQLYIKINKKSCCIRLDFKIFYTSLCETFFHLRNRVRAVAPSARLAGLLERAFQKKFIFTAHYDILSRNKTIADKMLVADKN